MNTKVPTAIVYNVQLYTGDIVFYKKEGEDCQRDLIKSRVPVMHRLPMDRAQQKTRVGDPISMLPVTGTTIHNASLQRDETSNEKSQIKIYKFLKLI